MKKYIIKNCPACILDPSCCAQWHINNGNTKDCSDITDCVIKRIVELCKNARNERDLAFLKIKFTGADIAKLYGKADLTTEILELLEIEEIKNENR